MLLSFLSKLLMSRKLKMDQIHWMSKSVSAMCLLSISVMFSYSCCCSSCNIDLKVSLAVEYTPPPDFDYNPDLGLFRAASGPFRLYCEVAGNTGAVTYYIQGPWYTPRSNHHYKRFILHARDTGNYTCTATDARGFTGETSTKVKVIGKSCLMCNRVYG